MTNVVSTQLSGTELKQQLLTCVQNEKASLVKVADAFYQQAHRPDESYVALCEALITTINNIESQGDWQQSSFLKNTLAPLIELRAKAQQIYQTLTGNNQRFYANERELAATEMKCFISLYQNRGHDLAQWALQLASIENYMMGRPIYTNEMDVQKVLRLKLSQAQEAYAVVIINKDSVMTNSEMRKDRIGNDLLTLKTASVTAAQIIEFVHVGRRYQFVNNRLVAK